MCQYQQDTNQTRNIEEVKSIATASFFPAGAYATTSCTCCASPRACPCANTCSQLRVWSLALASCHSAISDAPYHSHGSLLRRLALCVQLRILEAKPRAPSGRSLRQVAGGWLFQQADSLTPDQVRPGQHIPSAAGCSYWSIWV